MVLRHAVRLAREAENKRGRPRHSADLIDSIRVEGNVFFDLRGRLEWRFISPYGVDGASPANRNTVIGSVTLVGTIRRMAGPHRGAHIDISTGNVLNRWIRGLAQGQCLTGVCDYPAAGA